MARRVLISTLPPFEGGVPAKTRILAETLVRWGHRVTIAFYAPLSSHGHLDLRWWEMLSGRNPGVEKTTCFDGTFPAVAVGCRLPELEFSYYRSSPLWTRLIADHDRHMAVGGTVLVSNPLVEAGIPHLTWCASDMLGDRFSRRAAMPWPRRLIDRMVVGPAQAAMELRILDGCGRIATVARHAQRMFEALGCHREFGLIPIPSDPQRFRPPEVAAAPGVIGFAGRPNDPRKNISLLIEAVALARGRGAGLSLRLTGEPDHGLRRIVADQNATGFVEFTGVLSREGLGDFYRSLDVFAIPSEQEGFGIVGIEAMACGVPVVSTRCGGPEDYVRDGQTGFLVDHRPEAMAERLIQIAADRDLRRRLSEAARAEAVSHYAPAAFERALAENWRLVWGEEPDAGS